jgi:hypothetical protein
MNHHTLRFLIGASIVFYFSSTSAGMAGGTPINVRSYIIQGDTQNWAFSDTTAAEWRRTQAILCGIGAARILSTGDIVDRRDDAAQWARADAVYDVSDACGLPATLPAGNHDFEVAGSLDNFGPYDAFLRKRPLHRPLASSATGRAWVDRLEPNLVAAVLPYGIAYPAEAAWLEGWIASHPSERVILIKHDAVNAATGVPIGAASTLATRFGSRIVGVIGGHFLPTDRVGAWKHGGSFRLFSNYQLGAALGSRPEGLITMLDHYLSNDTWCIRTVNYLTGETDRFEKARCL